ATLPSSLPICSLAFEDRTTFFDKRLARLQMILGHCRARLMHRLHFEHSGKGLGFGGEQVALHIAVGDARPCGDAPSERPCFVLERLVPDHAIDQSKRGGGRAVDDVAEKVKFARLCRADEAGQSPGAAEVAGIAYPGKAGAEPRGTARNAQIAGHRAPQPGADRRTIHPPPDRFWEGPKESTD